MALIKASELKGVTIIPFGIHELDSKIHGVPTKKITEIFGPWSIGKSTLGYYLTTSAQNLGMEVLWADTENSLVGATEYPKLLGVDLERFNILGDEEGEKEKMVAEDYLDEILKWVRNKKNTLVILDSVGGLHPRAEAENEAGKSATGVRAKLVSDFVRKVKPYLLLNNNALVVLNHQYNPINFGTAGPASRFPEIKAAGGDKLEYAKDISLLLSETYVKDENDKVLKITRADGTKGGRFIKARIWKDKLFGTQWEEVVFALTVGQGVKDDWNMVQKCLDAEVITKEGNTYFFLGEKVCVGRPKLNEWAHENMETLKNELAGRSL